MLNNILIDKKILKAWLKTGYIDKGKLYPSKVGTPQGGVASPMLANMALDGLESAIKMAVPKRAKVNVIRYADDFIVTGDSKQILQEKIIPAIRGFLRERGLNLSGERTRITPIEDAFDFLGQTLRKYGDKLIITPSKSSVKAIVAKTRKIIKANLGHAISKMIGELNPAIRGWANYHRHACSKRIFAYVNSCIFKNLWNGLRRRHRDKGRQGLWKRYFRTIGSRNWFFLYDPKIREG
jgi:RNA-directed DNA polymerase